MAGEETQDSLLLSGNRNDLKSYDMFKLREIPIDYGEIHKVHIDSSEYEKEALQEILKQNKSSSSGSCSGLENKPMKGHFNNPTESNLPIAGTCELVEPHDHGTNILFRCEQCNRCFKLRYILRRHLCTHIAHKRFQCDLCGKAFSRRDKLKFHIAKHVQVIHPFRCDLCNRCFTEKAFLKRHLGTHTKHIRFQCDLCGRHYSKLYDIKQHMAKHSLIVGSKRAPRRPGGNCNICGKQYKFKSSLQEHYRVNHSQKYENTNLQCLVCSKVFKTPKNLKRHMAIHSEYQRFQCNFCGKQYPRRQQLDSHMSSHTGIKTKAQRKTCLCCICNKQVSFGNMKEHLKYHLDRDYTCDICGTQFVSERYLLRHIISHEKNKCKFCDKPFQCKKDLLQHVQYVHTQDRMTKDILKKEQYFHNQDTTIMKNRATC